MDRRSGFHRRWERWRPSDAQRRVLDALVEGRTNADIAVELGISPETVKWHISQLLGETGLGDRRALARWWQQRPARARLISSLALLKPSLAFAVVVAIALAGIAIFGSNDEGRTGSLAFDSPIPVAPTPTPWPEEAVASLARQDPPPSTCAPPEQQDLRLVGADELTSLGMVSAGRIAFVGHCSLYVANRADRALLWLGGGGYVRVPTSRIEHRSAVGLAFRLESGQDSYRVNGSAVFEQVHPDLPDYPEASVVRVSRVHDEGVYLMIVARESADSGQLGGQVGARHRVAFTSDGEMFIDPDPIPDALAVNWLTGEEIDVSEMVEVGLLVPTYAGDNVRTDCSPICAVYYQPGQEGIRAPADGTLRCIDEGDGQTFAFDSDDFHLRLRGFGGASFSASCEQRSVAAGDRLLTATYTVVKAVDADGSPLSLVATRDGRLFVGMADLQFGCPCDGRT